MEAIKKPLSESPCIRRKNDGKTIDYIFFAEGEKSGNGVEVSVYYDLGGYSCFTGTSRSRAIRVAVREVEIEIFDGKIACERFAIFGNWFCMTLEECARYSEKKLSSHNLRVGKIAHEIAEKYNETKSGKEIAEILRAAGYSI